MSDTLIKEVILHGNLEVAFTLREIKKIEVKDFYNSMKDFNINKGGIYRFFLNYKNFLTAKEFELIKENKSDAKYLIEIIKIVVDKAKENRVFETITMRINTCDYNSIIKIFIYHLLYVLECKIKNYLLENKELEGLHKMFSEEFKEFSSMYRTEYLFIDHVIPLSNDSFWKPSWKITYKNEDFYLEGIDTFTDNIFIYPKILCYSELMYLELKYINDRIIHLKNNAFEYYVTYIKDCVEILSKNIFDTFPLQIIYKYYYGCMMEHNEFYKPELIKFIKLEDLNKDTYILSILPTYLIAYLLGFPILRADIPSYKNMLSKLTIFNSDYFENMAINFNKKYVDLISMGINFGNGQDEGDNYTDVYGNRVIDFNIDDIIHIFNNEAFFLFTSCEFYELSKKGENFYNRSEFKNLDMVHYNLRFKRKVKKFFNNRGMKIELNSTMKENFLEIKTGMKNQEIIIKEENGNRGRGGLNFFNENYVNYFALF